MKREQKLLNLYISTKWFQCIPGSDGEMVLQIHATEEEMNDALRKGLKEWQDERCHECGAIYTWSTHHRHGCSVVPF